MWKIFACSAKAPSIEAMNTTHDKCYFLTW